jgi:LysR family transcriptional regulator, glycine cleavage system transcriptional activator
MAGRRELPSLRALAAFEAAGRQRSFSRAARELGMSQSAVSQQVAGLEAELGRPLFDRGHRGVTPNADGLALLHAATAGFDAIEAAARAVRCRPSVGVLQVATDFGFAAWWLMPRLAALQGCLPGVEVRILTSQQEDELHPQTDVSVVFGRGPWPGCVVQRLTRERVMPVCSPQVLARLGAAPEPAALGQLRLLHLAAPAPGRWLSWQDWFAHHGIQRHARRDDLTFDSYQLVLQAALQGQGAALGWAPLTDGLMQDGSLVAMAADALESDRGYHLVVPQERVLHPAVVQFSGWLLGECQGL